MNSVARAHAMPLPSVTIISVVLDVVASGRRAEFERMIASLRSQTCPREAFEHIVIDGGSDDGTVEILEELRQAGDIDAYVSEPDEGIYDAMNKGLSRANGQYCWFVNSDDRLMADALERALRVAGKAPGAVVYGDARIGDQLFRGDAELVWLRMPFCHQAMMAPTATLKEEGGFDTGLTISGDFDLVLRLAVRGCLMLRVGRVLAEVGAGGLSSDEAERFKQRNSVLLRHVFAGTNVDQAVLRPLRDAPHDIHRNPRAYLNLLAAFPERTDAYPILALTRLLLARLEGNPVEHYADRAYVGLRGDLEQRLVDHLSGNLRRFEMRQSGVYREEAFSGLPKRLAGRVFLLRAYVLRAARLLITDPREFLARVSFRLGLKRR